MRKSSRGRREINLADPFLDGLTGTYGVETIPGKPAIRFVGGSTDAAELVFGGTVHWIQRKKNCPVNLENGGMYFTQGEVVVLEI